MNLTDTTTHEGGGRLDAPAPDPAELDELAGLDDGERLAPRPVTLAVHAGAVLGQARALTFGDLLDCGPGLAPALEDLAAALATGNTAEIKGAALELVELVEATAPARAALDGTPHATITGITPAPPRRSHADRRAPLLGSIELMAEALAA